MKILAVVTDGFEDIEAVGTIALLRRARLDVTVASLTSDRATGRYGTEVIDLARLSNLALADYDMLLIPGGPEYIAEEKNPMFLAMVRTFAAQNKYLAAICAGPTILGHLGLLQGKRYTCFTSMNEDFGGTYVDQYAVVDGKLITGRSCAATIDFALAIVGTLKGPQALESLKREIYYDQR
ncbi:MAG: DJ-1/PfpI family protein [Bacilli bacterium]|jgi:4-methyl-5(b-hydroxyethyl)-thiazole monophosphate biosynthesis|nr:DJ-1/PfpI family protein [Bacilli bacterium]